MISIVKEIQQNLADVSTDWVKSIDEFLNLFQKEKITVEQVVKMDKLKPVFGRELIYVSAIKGV